MIEVELKAKCFSCEDDINVDNCYLYCSECQNKIDPIDPENLINELAKYDYEWKDEDFYVGFNNEEQKKAYLRGIEKGYKDCLFWVADYFDKVDFFENLEWK